MKLVFDKNGNMELEANGVIKPHWATAWDGDYEARPNLATKVQALRLAEPVRRPLNSLLCFDCLSGPAADFMNQLSYFFAVGRTGAAHKEAVRKNLLAAAIGVFCLGLLVLSVATCQRPQDNSGKVVLNSAVRQSDEKSKEVSPTAGKQSIENPAPSFAGQAPFILPSSSEAKAVEPNDQGPNQAPASNKSEPTCSTTTIGLSL